MSWTSITTTLQCWKGMRWKNCHNDLIGKNLASFTRTHPVPAGVSEEASQTNYSRSNHYFWRWGTNSQDWVSRGLCMTFEWEVRPLMPVLHYYVIKLRSLNRCQCNSLIHTHTHTHTKTHSHPHSHPDTNASQRPCLQAGSSLWVTYAESCQCVCVCLSTLNCVSVSMCVCVSMSEVVFGKRDHVW